MAGSRSGPRPAGQKSTLPDRRAERARAPAQRGFRRGIDRALMDVKEACQDQGSDRTGVRPLPNEYAAPLLFFSPAGIVANETGAVTAVPTR